MKQSRAACPPCQQCLRMRRDLMGPLDPTASVFPLGDQVALTRAIVEAQKAWMYPTVGKRNVKNNSMSQSEPSRTFSKSQKRNRKRFVSKKLDDRSKPPRTCFRNVLQQQILPAECPSCLDRRLETHNQIIPGMNAWRKESVFQNH